MLHKNIERKVCPGYNTKQSYGEAPVILELRGMRSVPLPSLLGTFRLGVVAPDSSIYESNRSV